RPEFALHELDTAAATFDVGATMIGEGKLYNSGAIDTRPDYIITGTTMTVNYNLSANLRNFRNITFTSKVDSDGADIECQLLTQASAEIQNSIVRSNALTNVACLQDPTFGSTTGLHDTDFIQSGVGHAIEVLATSTLTGIGFTGYGGTPGSNLVESTGSADAAIFNDTGGAITITVVGGDTPSVRNGAGATTTVVAATTVTFDKLKDNTEVRVYAAGTTTELDGIENATAGSTDDRNFPASISSGTSVDYVIHKVGYEYIRVESFTWPSVNQTLDIAQRVDRNDIGT
ncbi:unnamed protein product, partial [marine sediment metagenome]